MATGSKAKRGRPRDAATHQSILDAANGILEELGCRSFSIEAVAARAGVSKAAIYRRWPSKGALLVDLYMLGLEASGAGRVEEGRSAEAEFTEYFGLTITLLDEPIWAQTLSGLMAECQGNPEIASLMRERIVEPRREVGRRIIARGIRTGELAADTDVELLLDFVFGAIWYRLLLGHAPLDAAFLDAVRRQVFGRTDAS